jgi:hypothetical protein
VDDLLSLQEGVDQPGRNVQNVIQNLAETGAGEAPPSAGVPQRAFEEAMQAGEQRTARVADELRVAFESERKCGNAEMRKCGNAEMTLRAAATAFDGIENLSDMVVRMGSRRALTRNCSDILQFCAGRWELMTFLQYCLDRLTDVIFGKPPRCQEIVNKPSTWNGWFSNPQFFGYSVVAIKFQEGVCVVIDRYSLGSGIRGLQRCGYLRSWELQGCIRRKWQVLDEQKVTDSLSDSEPHEFHITKMRCTVEVVRLCQTGRNCLGSCRMHLTTFLLSGDVISPPGMLGMDDSAEAERFWPESQPSTSVTSPVLDLPHNVAAVAQSSVNERSPVSVVRDSDLGSIRDEGRRLMSP